MAKKPLISSKIGEISWKKNCWNHEWFQWNLSNDGWGFKKTSKNPKYNRKSTFWKTKYVFQKLDFLSKFGKMIVFLKPCEKMKSHYIAVILMINNDDFLVKWRVLVTKLRHNCFTFYWKTCFSHQDDRNYAEFVFFISGFKPKNGPM